jgi:ribosomal subunit interface protein
MIRKGTMDKQITFRNMEHSDVMENYINQQLEKIEKYLENEREPIYIELVLEPSKVHAHHRVELRVKTPRYYLVEDYTGPDFYPVLDHVIDAMYRQILEKKKELVDENKKKDVYHGA